MTAPPPRVRLGTVSSSPRPDQKPKDRMPGVLPYFATAAKGTEGLLREELRDLGIYPVRGDRGGVHFGRGLVDAFRVCLMSRIAVRVLERRAQAEVTSSDQLYQAIRAIDFSDVLEPERTLKVTASVRSSRLTHSQFVSRRVKDAVVDVQRERFGRRSDVDTGVPDVHLFVHLVSDRMTLYVDLAGDSLGKRGYRVPGGAAPLKETLAAALLRLAGYDGSTPFIDPLCGTGTIVLEAAEIALGRAPGLGRPGFALEGFPRVTEAERALFGAEREGAQAAVRPELEFPVVGSDIDLEALGLARAQARRLGVPVEFMRRDILALEPPFPEGILVTNPPYGVRLTGGEALDRRIGEALAKWQGYRLVVLSAGRELMLALRSRPAFEHTLFNGDIECRAFGWEL